MGKSDKKMTIKSILNRLPTHPYVLFYMDDPIELVKRRLEEIEFLRNIYVLDSQDRLAGYLSLGRIIRYFTSMRRKTGLHYHTLLEFVSAKIVMDLMEEDIVFAWEESLAEEILDIMIARGIKEVPVVDKNRQVIGNIGILDLWRITEDEMGD